MTWSLQLLDKKILAISERAVGRAAGRGKGRGERGRNNMWLILAYGKPCPV